MLPDSWQEIPVHKFKMCIYSRESSFFGLLWRSDQGMEIEKPRNTSIFPVQRQSLPREHRSKSVYMYLSCEKIKDIKLVIFTLIVLLLTYNKNHFAKSFTFS